MYVICDVADENSIPDGQVANGVIKIHVEWHSILVIISFL